MSENYKTLIEQAERLRHVDKCQDAIGFYEQALKIGGDLDVHCQQMIGVCLNGMDKPAEALDWLDKALDLAVDDMDKGAIWRDKSASYRKLKHFDEAENSIKQAFNYLSIYNNPSGAAATLSFCAQIEWEQGQESEALNNYKIAAAIMRVAGDKAAELYNALKYAYALFRQASQMKPRRWRKGLGNWLNRWGASLMLSGPNFLLSMPMSLSW